MRRNEFTRALLELFGLHFVEQRLEEMRMDMAHHADRMRFAVGRVLPYAAVGTVLTVYAAGAITLAVRKARAAAARSNQSADDAPVSGTPSGDGAVSPVEPVPQSAGG
jgi:hypothetical protein